MNHFTRRVAPGQKVDSKDFEIRTTRMNLVDASEAYVRGDGAKAGWIQMVFKPVLPG